MANVRITSNNIIKFYMSKDLKIISILAKQFLDNKEYSLFSDLFHKINERVKTYSDQKNDINTTDKNLKYPYDIDIQLNIKLYKNNQIGERVELVSNIEKKILKKISIGQEPNTIIQNTINTIENINNI